MQFIKNQFHGVLDYLVALTLIAVPFVLGFEAINPVGHWLSVGAGAGLFVYSLLTGYSLGLRNMIPYRVHLWFDLLAGAVFVAAPFVLGFAGTMKLFYLVMGGAVIVVVALSDPKVNEAPVPAGQ